MLRHAAITPSHSTSANLMIAALVAMKMIASLNIVSEVMGPYLRCFLDRNRNGLRLGLNHRTPDFRQQIVRVFQFVTTNFV